MRSPRLKLNHILTDFTDNLLASRLTRLARTAQEATTDHGVTTLFVAFGFLRWYEREDSNDELLSPLLLIPVQLARAMIESEYTLRTDEDEVLPNHCLAEPLQTLFRITCPSATDHPLDPESPDCLTSYLAAIRDRIKHVARWDVIEEAALGVFHFQKLAMWEDLGRNAQRLKENTLCRAIAGDSETAVGAPRGLPAAADLDRLVSPESTVHILDADSSQQEAIEAVKSGATSSWTVHPARERVRRSRTLSRGPCRPGKPCCSSVRKLLHSKSSNVDSINAAWGISASNCIATDPARKRSSRNWVAVSISLRRAFPIFPQLRQLSQDRQKLNDFVAELHAIRHPFGWSAFRAHGELARLDRGNCACESRSRTFQKRMPSMFDREARFLRASRTAPQ